MGLFSSECASCGSKEHATSDCPHGLFSNKCASCGSTDHSTSGCPHGIFSNKCASCGSKNHATKDCPHGLLSTKCASCGSIEHSTKDCPHGLLSTKCASCGSKNHSTADCPHGIFSSKSTHRKESYPTSSEESGGLTEFFGKAIGWLIGVIIIIAIVIWLAVNIVLPIALLNSALALTILAVFFKKHKTILAVFALVGGIYMLFDTINGWLSANFVDNVVNNPSWITAFVYINSAAIGVSTWLLVQPIWSNSLQKDATDKRKSILLKGSSILLIVLTTLSIPILYHTIENRFLAVSKNESYNTNTADEIEGDTDSPDIILENNKSVSSSNQSFPGRFPQASERILSASDLSGLNKSDLKIMRNEIFARHGYIFKTSEMKSYFATQPWYDGQYDDVASRLSNIEQQNVALIKKNE